MSTQSDGEALSGENIEELEPKLKYTGTQINYYFVCKRKLWFFSHNMELENESDLVLLGKLLHQHSYIRRLKEIEIQRIKIDFIERSNEVHEVKRSRKIEKAHIYQLLYYLYFLKHFAGVRMKGVLNYPLLKKRFEYELTEQNEKELSTILTEISNIVALEVPPQPEWMKYCSSCAYRELCWG